MADTVLLVDFENAGKIDLAAVPVGVRVLFCFGASQKTVPTEFLKSALKLGDHKGFDPLIKHLAGRGFSVRREATLGAAFPRAASKAAASASRSSPERWQDTELQRLVDMEEAKRPRTRLVAHVYNHRKKEIAEALEQAEVLSASWASA